MTPVTLVHGTAWGPAGAMSYFQTGRGRPVLLLHDVDGLMHRASMLASLAQAHRLIVPDLTTPADGGSRDKPQAAYLRDLLDALGFDGVTVIADADHAMAALRVALTEPDLVERLVLLTDGPADPPPSALADRFEQVGTPFLVLPWADDSGSLTDFLAA
jgi:pimeloyl-ACP methyl ester carboxylesterase